MKMSDLSAVRVLGMLLVLLQVAPPGESALQRNTTGYKPISISGVTTPTSGLMTPTSNLTSARTQGSQLDDSNVTHSPGSLSTVPMDTATTTMTMTTRISTPVITKSDNSNKAGIFILVFIIIAIVLLIVILYFMRKNSRRYSFDLNRTEADATPLRKLEQHGTFEQTQEKSIGQVEKGHVTNSVANGASPQAEETESVDKNMEKWMGGGSLGSQITLTPPMKKVDFNLIEDLKPEPDPRLELRDVASSGGSHGNQPGDNKNISSLKGEMPPEELFTEISLGNLE